VAQKHPEPWKLERWKDAIRWFFRTGYARRLPEPPAKTEPPKPAESPSAVGARESGQAAPVAWSEWIEATRRLLRIRHLSYRTEQSYLDWVRRLVRRYRDRPSAEVREAELRAFLDELAQAGRVSASTQRQALNALVFLFREVMGRQLGDLMFMCSTDRAWR
jgi:hypothetical protein